MNIYIRTMKCDRSQHDKVLSALDRIILDADGQINECAVNQFLDYYNEYLQELGPDDQRRIVNTVITYAHRQSVVMLNYARLFKIIAKSGEVLQFDEIQTRDIWAALDVALLNRHVSALFWILKIAKQFINLRDKLRFEPSITIRHLTCDYAIGNIYDLCAYCIQTCLSFQIADAASDLYSEMIILDLEEQSDSNLEHMTITLISRGSNSLLSVIIGELEQRLDGLSKQDQLKRRNRITRFINRSSIRDALLSRLQHHIERDKTDFESNNELKRLCKVITSTQLDDSQQQNICSDLKRHKKLESVITLMASDLNKGHIWNIYVLYPLLLKSKSQNGSKELIMELGTTSGHDIFIESCFNQNTPPLCLSIIYNELGLKCQSDNRENSLVQTAHSRLEMQTINLCIRVIINYVEQHFEERTQYKNIMTCLDILLRVSKINSDEDLFKIVGDRIRHFLFECVGHRLQSLTELDRQSYITDFKPIILSSIELVCLVTSIDSKNPATDVQAATHNRLRLTEFARLFTDHDVLNEIVLLYEPDLTYDSSNSEQQDDYADLVWRHIYAHSKTTRNQSFPGNLVKRLLQIDHYSDISTLKSIGVERHQHLLRAIGTILIEYSSFVETTELVVGHLANFGWHENCTSEGEAANEYLCSLLSPKFSAAVQDSLDHITGGLCVALESDMAEKFRVDCICLLAKIIKQMIIEYDNHKQIWTRVENVGLDATIQRVAGCDLYHARVREIAVSLRAVVQCLQNISRQSETTSANDTNEISVESSNAVIASFVTRSGYEPLTQVCDNLENVVRSDSIVDDIINYNLSYGTMDCY